MSVATMIQKEPILSYVPNNDEMKNSDGTV